jgi:hypothetical protein
MDISNVEDSQTKNTSQIKPKPKRKLGMWEGKATFSWVGDGKITLEEFGINFEKFDIK